MIVKKLPELLVLLLAVVMLSALTAACGDQKSDNKDAASAATEIAPTEAPTGSVVTKGQISVYVPPELEVDNESSEAQAGNTIKLISKEFDYNYVMIMTVSSEENAQEIIANTREANADNFPSDISFERNGALWSGFSLDLSATRVINAYAVINDKVFYITSAGMGKHFNIVDEDSNLLKIIDSLK